MLRTLICVAAVLGLMGSPAQALPQDGPQNSQEGREVLVRKYLDAIEFDKMMDAMTATMVEAQTASIPPGAITPEMSNAIGEVTTEVMQELRPAMMDRYVVLYAEVLTTEELSSLVRFYESPTGRAITTKSQIIAQRSGPIIQEMMPQMQQLMVQRLCGRVKCPEGLSAQPR